MCVRSFVLHKYVYTHMCLILCPWVHCGAFVFFFFKCTNASRKQFHNNSSLLPRPMRTHHTPGTLFLSSPLMRTHMQCTNPHNYICCIFRVFAQKWKLQLGSTLFCMIDCACPLPDFSSTPLCLLFYQDTNYVFGHGCELSACERSLEKKTEKKKTRKYEEAAGC